MSAPVDVNFVDALDELDMATTVDVGAGVRFLETDTDLSGCSTGQLFKIPLNRR